MVGDVTGAVSAYSTEADFAPLRVHAPAKGAASGGGICSVALCPRADGGLLVLSSAHDGALAASTLKPDPWPAQVARLDAPLAPLDPSTPAYLVAGPHGAAFSGQGAAVCMHDLDTAAKTWDGVYNAGSVAALAEGVADLHLSASGAASASAAPSAATLPSRPLSYSPFWHLLGAAIDRLGVVALWDVRAPGTQGPAAAVKVCGGDGTASWIHVDEGAGMAGQLLVATSEPKAPVQLFDIRRVPTARTAGAVQAVASLPLPANAECGCFAALGSTLVAGGGAKCGTSWRYCDERADETVAEDDEEEEVGKKGRDKKKKRLGKVETRGSRQSRMA